MHRPSWWLNNITLGNGITIIVIVFGAGIAWAQVSSLSGQMQEMKATQAEWRAERDKETTIRRAAVDAAMAGLATKVQPVDGLIYRLGVAEGGISSVNGRLDRVVEAMQHAVEPLSEKIATLTTRVEVLAVAIDRISPAPPGKRSDIDPTDGKQALR